METPPSFSLVKSIHSAICSLVRFHVCSPSVSFTEVAIMFLGLDDRLPVILHRHGGLLDDRRHVDLGGVEREEERLQLLAQRILIDHPPLLTLDGLDFGAVGRQTGIHGGHVDLVSHIRQELVHLDAVDRTLQGYVFVGEVQDEAPETVDEEVVLTGDVHRLRDSERHVDLGPHIDRHHRPGLDAARQRDRVLRGVEDQPAESRLGLIAREPAHGVAGDAHACVYFAVVQGRIDQQTEQQHEDHSTDCYEAA